ncbi:putative senescence regulator S40 [Helianthus annuus]|nr:putative senescence regulator S40 [Helianthus annuus]
MYRKGSSVWSSMFGNEEYQETDVWSVINERKDYDYDSKSVKSKGSTSGYSSRPTAAARMIPRPSINNSDIESRIPQQQSAPVNIPDWSKIYGTTPKRSSQKSSFIDYGYHVDDSDDDDDHHHGDGNMMPPHEWIAQKLARNQISSFSVCEGAGRTLKGRDLSRVRNAVLTKTGFLE